MQENGKVSMTSNQNVCNACSILIVVQMEPSISGVQVLLDQLNHNGNLKEFCKLLRLKFKHYVINSMSS